MLFSKQSLQCCRNCLPWRLHHSQPTKPFPFPIIQVIQGSIHGSRKQNRYAYTISTELIPDRPRERLQKSFGRRIMGYCRIRHPCRRRRGDQDVSFPPFQHVFPEKTDQFDRCRAMQSNNPVQSFKRSPFQGRKRSIPALLTNTSTSNSHEVTCW